MISEIRKLSKIKLYNPNLWELLLPTDILVDSNNSFLSKIKQYNIFNPAVKDSEKIKLLAQTVTLPFIEFETAERLDGKKYITDYKNVDTMDITFFETENLDIQNLFDSWQKCFYNKDTLTYKVGGSGMRRTGVLKLLKFKDTFVSNALNLVPVPSAINISSFIEEEIVTYKLIGLFPKKISELSLSYENTGALVRTITFSVDTIE